MRSHIIHLFFAATLLTGCGTNYLYPSHKITVYKIFSDDKDYELLSVRGDSAIVVLDWAENQTKPFPFSHTQVIHEDSIAWIKREGHGTGPPSIYGAVIGGAAGFVLAILDNGQYLGEGHTGTVHGWEFITACTIAGTAISTLFVPDKKVFLSNQQSIDFLRSISLYPDAEPDELKYIK